MNQTLEWNQHVAKVQSKVYAALASLRSHRRSLSFTLKTQLIMSLVIPHFDYALVVYMHVEKTRDLDLLINRNACIRFVYGYVPFNTILQSSVQPRPQQPTPAVKDPRK